MGRFIDTHVDDEDKGVAKCDTLGGTQKTMLINESGLYALILSSSNHYPDSGDWLEGIRGIAPAWEKTCGLKFELTSSTGVGEKV